MNLRLETTVQVDEADVRRFAYHVLYNEQFRFVFFSIPKVACTEWIKLFMRLKGVSDWQDSPHIRDDRPLLSTLPLTDVNQILNDPTWVK